MMGTLNCQQQSSLERQTRRWNLLASQIYNHTTASASFSQRFLFTGWNMVLDLCEVHWHVACIICVTSLPKYLCVHIEWSVWCDWHMCNAVRFCVHVCCVSYSCLWSCTQVAGAAGITFLPVPVCYVILQSTCEWVIAPGPVPEQRSHRPRGELRLTASEALRASDRM